MRARTNDHTIRVPRVRANGCIVPEQGMEGALAVSIAVPKNTPDRMPTPAQDSLSSALAALLGALQGITEFLPVSSSGHLSLAQAWLGVNPESADASTSFCTPGFCGPMGLSADVIHLLRGLITSGDDGASSVGSPPGSSWAAHRSSWFFFQVSNRRSRAWARALARLESRFSSLRHSCSKRPAGILPRPG